MLIEFESVSVSFDAKTALDNINLKLDQKRIGVIGLTGSGKSTLARLLNGLVAPTSGTVTVGEINPATNAKAARQQTGFIFSNPDVQIIMPTVLEDVSFTLRSSKLSKDEIRAKALAVLQRSVPIDAILMVGPISASQEVIVPPSAGKAAGLPPRSELNSRR